MSTMGLTTFETIAVWSVLAIAILGLGYAVFLRRQILREDKGTVEMQEVWDAIRQGADAYLSRQLRTICKPFLWKGCSEKSSTGLKVMGRNRND